MYELFEFFKAIGLIAGILFFIAIIYAIIKAFFLEITKKKRTEKAKQELEESFNELKKVLEAEKYEEEEPKKARKSRKCKEE